MTGDDPFPHRRAADRWLGEMQARYSGDGQRIAAAYERERRPARETLLLVWDTDNLDEPILRMPQNGLCGLRARPDGSAGLHLHRRPGAPDRHRRRLGPGDQACAAPDEHQRQRHPRQRRDQSRRRVVVADRWPGRRTAGRHDPGGAGQVPEDTSAPSTKPSSHPTGPCWPQALRTAPCWSGTVASGDLRERLVGQAGGPRIWPSPPTGHCFSASTTVDAGSVLAWDLAGDRRFLRRVVAAAAPLPELAVGRSRREVRGLLRPGLPSVERRDVRAPRRADRTAPVRHHELRQLGILLTVRRPPGHAEART